ncbi:MAG: diguanylate cyclase [Deltaproteobacteria bacterium]|nr:diguanylate cyclase [Deltaproteobacteria bacterium]
MLIAVAEALDSNQEFLESHLDRWGFESTFFSTGAAVLQRFQQESAPRILLVSWDIPGPAALEVCRRLRDGQENQAVHIIALVGRARCHEALEALREGLVDDCVLSPVDAYSLEARLAVARKSLALRGRLARTESELESQALKDGLTGLWNRDACLSFLRRELAVSQRDGNSVGAVILDLPALREVNQVHGFEVGNQVLCSISEKLRTAVRTTDWAGRFSGQQLLVVLPNCSELRAQSVAWRLRQLVREVFEKAAITESRKIHCGAIAAETGDGDLDRFVANLLADLTARSLAEDDS